MHTYRSLLIILLSFLLPLQAVADSMLSVTACLEMTAMDMSDMDTIAKHASAPKTPNCCDQGKTAQMDLIDCMQMPDCHGCNNLCHIYPFLDVDFSALLYTHIDLVIREPIWNSLDANGVWRPPTNS